MVLHTNIRYTRHCKAPAMGPTHSARNADNMLAVTGQTLVEKAQFYDTIRDAIYFAT